MSPHLNGASRIFPIIGDPIKYAESPVRLTQTFADRGQPGVCVPMQIAADDLEVALAGLTATGNVDGLLVTMPHKLAAFPYCATSSHRSQLLQVVSHMRRNADGSWHGDMFDGLSFVKAQVDHGATIAGSRALLIGAGGAGSAIAIELLEQGVHELVIHDPAAERVETLRTLLAGIGTGEVHSGAAEPTGFDLVFNATPLGMHDGDALPVDTSLLTETMFVGDVVAGHGETPFIAAASAAGCRTANGADMVVAGLELVADFMLSAPARTA